MNEEKVCFHHRAHRIHRENIFIFSKLSLWALCSLWLIFSFYEFIKGEPMKCRKCNGELVVKRSCRRVRLQCQSCRHEYQIHEVASDLDEKTSAILEQYTTIIYD